MSTEPSALAKAIHHGAGGWFTIDGPRIKRIEKAIREEFVLIDRTDLPEVTVNSAGDIVCGWLFLHSSGEPAKRAREYAAAYLAIAEHIESTQSAESVAAEKLTKRRDEVARELLTSTYGEDSLLVGYAGCIAQMQNAIDRIIELEQRS